MAMQDPAALAEDPTMTSPDEAEDGDKGYVICIHVGAGNKVQSVDVEDAAEDTDDAPAGTAASGIKQALSVALDIYKNGGMPSGSDETDGFAQGYGKGNAAAKPLLARQTEADM